jgi:hypothetical protein
LCHAFDDDDGPTALGACITQSYSASACLALGGAADRGWNRSRGSTQAAVQRNAIRVHPLHVPLLTNGRELGAGRGGGAGRGDVFLFAIARPVLLRPGHHRMAGQTGTASLQHSFNAGLLHRVRPCMQASQRPCVRPGVITRSDNRHQLTLRHARIGVCCSPNAGASTMEHDARVHAPHAPMHAPQLMDTMPSCLQVGPAGDCPPQRSPASRADVQRCACTHGRALHDCALLTHSQPSPGSSKAQPAQVTPG